MLATRDELAVLGKGVPGQRLGGQNASLKADLGSSPGYCQSEGSVQRKVEMTFANLSWTQKGLLRSLL